MQMLTLIGTAAALGSCGKEKATEPFRYTLDSFADIKVMRYQVPGWDSLSAVKNGRILNADSNEISRPGPRLRDAAETLLRFVQESEAQVPAA